jgi:hypothetical protein
VSASSLSALCQCPNTLWLLTHAFHMLSLIPNIHTHLCYHVYPISSTQLNDFRPTTEYSFPLISGRKHAWFRMLHQNAKCNNIHIRPHLRGVWLPWPISASLTHRYAIPTLHLRNRGVWGLLSTSLYRILFGLPWVYTCMGQHGLSVSVYLTHNLMVYYEVVHNIRYIDPGFYSYQQINFLPALVLVR